MPSNRYFTRQRLPVQAPPSFAQLASSWADAGRYSGARQQYVPVHVPFSRWQAVASPKSQLALGKQQYFESQLPPARVHVASSPSTHVCDSVLPCTVFDMSICFEIS